ncbi:MAG: ABC transporter permease [Actinomycetota bacterium]|nr:ABC transporter permease [Actinomycetota bacterium]
MPSASSTWTENRPRVGLRGPDLRELWAYRELGVFLALRDIKVRYKQAAFGVAWAIFQPLAGVVVFTVVFQRVASVASDGIAYPLFAFVGLTVWAYVSGSVTKATQSLVSNAALVTKVHFPRLMVPLAAVLPGLLDFFIAMPVLGVLWAVYGVAPGWAVLTFPLWVVAAIIVSLAVGLLLSALNVRYRDVNQAISLFIQLWLFLSPVAYPSTSVPDRWRVLYALNPMSGVIEGFRWALVGGTPPGWSLLLSAGVTLVLLVAAVVYFQRTERQFADVI